MALGGAARNLVLSALLAGGLCLSPLAAAEFDLRVAGGDSWLTERIRGVLTTADLVGEADTTPDDLLAAARADYRRVLAELYNRGYFAPVVSIRVDGQEASALSPFARLAQVGRIVVNVEPGPQFEFGQTGLAPLPSGVARPEYFTRGETATLERLRDAASYGVDAWRQRGHAKASLARQKITANQRARRIDADLTLAPGPQLRFGRLIITGTERLRPERAREIAGLPGGEVFDPEDLETSADRLRRTGVFRSVSLQEAETANPDGTLDIEAELLEQKPRRFGFGAEVSSLEGATISAFWLHRNLLGGAERFRVDGEVSDIGVDLDGVDYKLSFSLSRPATFHPDQTLELGLDLASINDPAYASDRIAARAGLERRYTDRLTVSYGVEVMRARTRDVFGTRDFLLLSLPVEAEYDRRNDILNPTRGYYIEAGITPFAGADPVGAGIRLTADARAYRGLGSEDRFVLAGRVMMGSVIGPDLADTPPDFLFFSGGGGTVRGHAFQSLGVPQPGGISGGRSLLVASAELRARVRDKWQVVGFYDAGFVGAGSTPGVDAMWHAGAGLGIRYDTGLGPIRLDVATPVSGGDAFERAEIYVGIGQSF